MSGGGHEIRGRFFNKGTSKFWIFIAMGAVSTAAILIRLSDSHPLGIAVWRLLIAEIILLPFFLWSLKDKRGGLTGRKILELGLVGFSLAFHFALWIWSFEFTKVSSSVVLVTTHPLFVAAISVWFFKEKLGSKAVMGMFIALVGSFILIGGDLTISGETLTGNLLALGGAVMAGIYILAGSRYRKTVSLPAYAFTVYLWASLFLLIAILILGVDMIPSEPREYLILTALALGPMLAGHTVYNWALKFVSPTFVSVSLLGEPVGSTILALLILSEAPGLGALIGGPIVLFGIYMVARNTK